MGKPAKRAPDSAPSSGFWVFAIFGAALACVGNFAYQVWKKPTEAVGLFEGGLRRTPYETWRAYGADFVAGSTPLIRPELLAALAQAETSGNPIARTYWKWRWTSDLARIYSPASSAVGLFQMTDGTFEEAKRYCLSKGLPRQAESGGCAARPFLSRLIPSHAIELTAARLHWISASILRGHPARKATERNRRELAAIVHLCGQRAGEAFARANFQSTRLGRCGDHDPRAYLRSIETEFQRFRRLRSHARLASASKN